MTRMPESTPPLKRIGHVYRTFARLADSELRDLGFAMSQLPVLIALKKGEALTQAELARIAKVEQPSMAQLLNRMERDGLVRRAPAPDDKRIRVISLTAHANRLLPKAKAMMDALSDEALRGFSAADVKMLDTLISRIAGNLARAAGERAE